MNDYLKVYENNKKLDLIYKKTYNIGAREMLLKDILALLVEYGEFANETRCFKYWSKKPMSEKSVVLEESADCFILTFIFCDLLNIDISKIKIKPQNKSIVELFIYLYKECSLLQDKFTIHRVKSIIINLRQINILLGFTDKEIVEAIVNKIEKNFLRLSSNY